MSSYQLLCIHKNEKPYQKKPFNHKNSMIARKALTGNKVNNGPASKVINFAWLNFTGKKSLSHEISVNK